MGTSMELSTNIFCNTFNLRFVFVFTYPLIFDVFELSFLWYVFFWGIWNRNRCFFVFNIQRGMDNLDGKLNQQRHYKNAK